jgi:hypothetical protein
MSVEFEKIENGKIYYAANFLDFTEGWEYFEKFKNEIKWQQEFLKIYGKEIQFPRLTSWYGDPKTTYKYSGVVREPMHGPIRYWN